ncbi:MAG TPA: globin domain-containing protein, partial [Nocardioidaceae bacterium]|nr:globin domain-containing protein [Nocardioidaceae bacterium]
LLKTPEQLPVHLLSRIAHKHASLGIRPDQYEIVHDNLFWAIVDVLGDAVTAEVAAAWDEVYWLMAYALINQERGLYSARGVRPETVWREWEVAEKIRETEDVVTFRMRRVDDRLVKTSLPGQYVTVQVPLPDGEVSNLLVDEVDVGDRLTMSLPFGDVVLDDSGRPVVFASAGIGVTPMAGMISHLATAGSRLPITLLHADTDEGSFALRNQVLEDLRSLPGASAHVWYENGADSSLPVEVHAGMMNVDDVKLPDDALYYLCGPVPFMRAVRSALIERDVPARDIQYEVFGPDLWQADLVSEPTPGAESSGPPEA